MKGEVNSSTIIMGDFNTPLSSIDRSPRKKINKGTQASSDTLHQMDLLDIYRALCPIVAGYIFFSSTHGTYSKTDHMLGPKLRLGKI